MQRRWSVRKYREGDEQGILELWKAVYPSRKYDPEPWLKWWRRMYKDNPAGSGRIWLAEDNDKIVGQYAIVPVKAKVGSKIILAAQSLDTMTHPDYRHQKIFETLAKQVYDEAKGDDILLIYGFPNKFSYPGFIKRLNWFDIYSLQIVIKPLNWESALRLRIKNKVLLKLGAISGTAAKHTIYRTKKAHAVRDLTIAQISSFDDQIDEFWTRVSSQHQVMVVRSKDYLNWRYRAPGANYSIFVGKETNKICGYLVLRCMQEGRTKTGVVFDVLAESEQISQRLISEAVEQCEREKVDAIYGLMLADKTLITAFKKTGFISLPFLRDGQFIVYSSSPPVSKAFLRKPKNWFVQIGDSDKI